MKTKKKKGFTLTELIVVIVIIGVLAAVMIPSLTGYITKAQNSNDETLVTLLNQELEHQKLLDDDLEFYTAYDVDAFLKEVGRENIEVANKKSIILFDTEINQFVLVKEDEQSKALVKTNFVYHISEYYSINHDFYDEEDENKPQETKLGYSKLSNSKCDKVDCKTHRAFIVSINGPEIAKVVKAVMDLPYEENNSDLKKIIDSSSNEVKLLAYETILKTVYINKNNKTFYYDSDLKANNFDNSSYDSDKQVLTRVIALPEVETVDLNLVNKLQNSTIIIPSTAETVEDTTMLANNSVAIGNVEDNEKDYETSLKELEIKELTFVNSEIYSETQLFKWKETYDKLKEDSTLKEKIKAIDSTWELKSEIIIMNNFTIKSNFEIPKDVTLFIPYDDNKINIDGYITQEKVLDSVNIGLKNDTNNASHGFAKINLTSGNEDRELLNRELIIGIDVTLDVNGKIVIGGVTGQNVNELCGHTSGAYGQIKNNGLINLHNSSVLDVYGYVIGEGEICAENGAIIYEPFVIGDYAGGSNTAILSANKPVSVVSDPEINKNGLVTPFSQYSICNIQCDINMKSGAVLKGYSRVWFGTDKKYIDNVITMIGNTADSFMYLKSGSALLKYDKSEALSLEQTIKSNVGITNVGKTIITVNGNVETGNINLNISVPILNNVSINSNDFLFPIPFNFKIIFKSGKSEIKNQLAFLPGSELIIESSAELTIEESSALFIFDVLVERACFSSYYYVYPQNLNPSNFIVNGILTIEGVFGGIVQNKSSEAKISVKNTAIVDGSKLAKFGSQTRIYDITIKFDAANCPSILHNYKLEGMIFIENELKKMEIGNYSSANSEIINVCGEENKVKYVKCNSNTKKDIKNRITYWETIEDEISRSGLKYIGSWKVDN